MPATKSKSYELGALAPAPERISSSLGTRTHAIRSSVSVIHPFSCVASGEQELAATAFFLVIAPVHVV
jgi:hypothetical protein